MALTIKEIDNAKPRDKRWKLIDGGGLYLLIRPTGVKSWCFDYRHGGKRKTATIGTFPAVGLKEAREQHQTMRQQLAQGLDPSRVKIEAKAAAEAAQNQEAIKVLTFDDVAQRFFACNTKLVKPKTKQSAVRRYKLHVKPVIGAMPFLSVKPLDVIEVLRNMEAKGIGATKNHVQTIIKNVFGFAIAEGLTDYDPSQNIKQALKPVPATQHHRALDIKEVGAFLRDLEDIERSTNRNFFKLIALTALRCNELRNARWDEIKDGVLEIPAHKMKQTRQVKNKPHIVFLSRQALAVLAEQRQLTGSFAFIFAGYNKPMQPISMSSPVNALAAIGWHEKTTIHGFRSLFSTACNEAGFNSDIIEAQLAHKETNAVRAAYNRAEHLEKRAALLQWWGDTLDHLKAGGEFSQAYLLETRAKLQEKGLF